MHDLPVMLRVAGRRCVIVGGGAVATRRARALLDAGATVTVISPEPSHDLEKLPVLIKARPYQHGDLSEAFLVVIASNDPAANQQAADDANGLGILTNRADDAASGDIEIPAHERHGKITIAVHSGGVSAAAAATIRRQLSDSLDPDWPVLVETIEPFRAWIQDHVHDRAARQDKLVALAGDEAMTALKSGGPDALRRYCQNLLAIPHVGV